MFGPLPPPAPFRDVSRLASDPSSSLPPLEQADGHSTKPVQHQSERRAGAP